MTLNEKIRSDIAGACFIEPGDCRACERKGLPILPLRRGIVGAGVASSPQGGGLSKVPTADGLRTLRTGYLYVLLDKTVWQAYAVTPQGCLRQFNPSEMPQAEPAPLSECCVAEGHDIVSAFFNVDTARYNTAWVAFASDPWPPSVLDAYRTGRAPTERFTQLDLRVARDNPAGAGMVMTPDALQVDTQVFEYANANEGDFGSIHGFHSRAAKQDAVRGFVRTAMLRHRLPQGVLALVLEDPVGRVQELDAMRTKWIDARARWAAEPERAYRKLTSDTLLQIKDVLKKQAQGEGAAAAKARAEGDRAYNATGLAARAPRKPIDEASHGEQVAGIFTEDAHEKLEERYDETRRAAFASDYDRTDRKFQQAIDEAAKTWVAAIESPDFLRIDEYDYEGEVADSGLCYARTMCKCLRGGMTDAPDEKGEVHGPTSSLWESWLGDPVSPPYKTLALRNKSVLEGLRPTFDDKDEIEWNDAQTLYGAIVTLINSEEIGEKLLYASVREASAITLGALHGAQQMLRSRLSVGVNHAAIRLTQTALYLHERVFATQVRVTTTVGELYHLHCQMLREQQEQLVHQASSQTRQQVRSLLASGVLTLQPNAAQIMAEVVEVTLWVQGSAADVAREMGRSAEALTLAQVVRARGALAELRVGQATLEANAQEVLRGLPVSQLQAERLVRSAFERWKAPGTSAVSLLLAVGNLYLVVDGLQSSYKALDEAVGAKHPEAMAAFAGSSIGLAGGGIETVGLALQTASQTADALRRAAAPGSLTVLAEGVARTGAVIGAATGVFDAVKAEMAAERAKRAGDRTAVFQYRGAMILSILGAGLSGYSASTGATALLGGALGITPLGIAILCSLAAYAVYKAAEGNESTHFDRWARRCYFGDHQETPSVAWDTSAYRDVALAELAAAVLGMDLGVELIERLEPSAHGETLPATPAKIVYKFVLPKFQGAVSAYRWSLLVHRHSDFSKALPGDSREDRFGDYVGGQMLAQGAWNSPGYATPGSSPVSDGKRASRKDYEDFIVSPDVKNGDGVLMRGEIRLKGFLERHSIEAATLRVTYWPDREQPDLYAEIVLQEVR